MKYKLRKFLTIITIICLIIAMEVSCFAHSGRTDSSGGHKDNQNKSGLGSYHYHCGGYSPHLHENGICPYSSTNLNSSSSIASSSNDSASNYYSNSNNIESVTASSNIEKVIEPESEPIIEATSVEINSEITSMMAGETIKLNVNIEPENTEDKEITWKSDNDEIATINSEGEIQALKKGTVIITATTNNNKTDMIVITVDEIEEENDTNVVSTLDSEFDNEYNNTTEDADSIVGILGLSGIGAGSYLGYNKYKKSKN